MPPSKRAKKSAAAAAAVPAPSPSVPPSLPNGPLKAEPEDDVKTRESTPTSIEETDVSEFDPALLDEEETPGGASPSSALKTATTSTTAAATKTKKEWQGKGYNALKTFKGQVYSGMAVGGSHTWKYEEGTWVETKEEPDLWKVDYTATKRRAGKRPAPRGSGAPVGTEYHWFIVAHQYVKKLDANTYSTHLVGAKYKLAHKGAAASSWSIPTVRGQREREIELLEDAKRRVQGLPAVPPREKVKVEKEEKGQQKLDTLFSKKGGVAKPARGGEGEGEGLMAEDVGGRKRKREEGVEG
ncbi:hypothetical protein LshimejAT787_0311140 [Lyophyllum shimeji]|uniref:Uncharacterized protein n=1 Tax=Lyophyllum shimeji TaxID=47721 RepID=A0A9P3PK66_LYOSH|nr:hypothetical protein LshimejAT787_0311140 [Lyophyllum shimeji]